MTKPAPQRSMELSDDAEVRLLTCPRPPREELRVAFRSYRGTDFVDVRTWYADHKAGAWKPGRGISLRLQEVAQVATALAEAAKRLASEAKP